MKKIILLRSILLLTMTSTAVLISTPPLALAKSKKLNRPSALVSRPPSNKKGRLLNWQDYKKMSAPQRSTLIASLKGIFQEIDNAGKKPGSTGGVQKFMGDWEAGDASMYKDSRRLLTFDAYVMVASHFCEKHGGANCSSFTKICKENIK